MPSLSHAETMGQAITHAVENHPSIHASMAAANAAHATIQEEESAFYPTANVTGSFGRVYSDNTTTRGLSVTRGTGYSWFGEGTGNISQTLYDWNATASSVNAARHRFDSADASVDGQRQAVAAQAAQAYLQLLRAQKLLSKANDNHAIMTNYFNRIEAAFAEGGADEGQVSQAQDLVSLASNAILQYEADYKIAQANYRQAIGRLPQSDVQDPALSLTALPTTEDAAVEKAIANNPQMRALESEMRAADADIDREKVSYLPVLNAELSALKRDQKDLIGGEAEDVRGLLKANWDYAFGGAQQAAYKRAQHLREQTRHDYEVLRRVIERDVNVAWASYHLAKNRKTNEIERLQAADKTLETYQEQYEGGQQSLLDVMGAANARFLAQQDYNSIFYEEMNAALNLKAVIGLPLTPQDAAHDG